MVQIYHFYFLKYFENNFADMKPRITFVVSSSKNKHMTQYFKIATAQVRPLQMKNCYDWTLVRYDSQSGNCYFILGQKLNVLPLRDVLAIHKKITKQKPYEIKTVAVAEFYGVTLSIIDYAAQNNLEPQQINNDILSQARQVEKSWPGYILKPVNDLSFIKN